MRVGRGPKGRRASGRTGRCPSHPRPKGSWTPRSGGEEDPIATELAAAKSYTEWARKQKAGPARDKELAVAQKCLAEAELADKRRKPPAERLQSALSRVNHWDREWDAVTKEREAALAVLEARGADLANTGVMREDARRELETAQALHAAWGQAQGGEAGTYQSTTKVVAQQELIFKQINENLQAGSLASAHFIELMATMGYLGIQREAQTIEGTQGQEPPGKPPVDHAKGRKQRLAADVQAGKEEGPRSAGARSRSRQAREAKARAAATEAAARARAAEEGGAATDDGMVLWAGGPFEGAVGGV